MTEVYACNERCSTDPRRFEDRSGEVYVRSFCRAQELHGGSDIDMHACDHVSYGQPRRPTPPRRSAATAAQPHVSCAVSGCSGRVAAALSAWAEEAAPLIKGTPQKGHMQ